MREVADAERIHRFMQELGRAAREPGRVYFTGGATAVLHGWRRSTIDVDIRLEPDRDDLLRAIAELKEQLSLNVELASPPDFIPAPDGWADRSEFVAQEGALAFYHFDLYSQALAKIERGHAQDLEDVQTMLGRGLIDPVRLRRFFDAIAPRLHRYPAVDPRAFARAIDAALR